MPTLSQLKSKWFLDFDAPENRLVGSRHPGSTLTAGTDGNKITKYIDGHSYVSEWFQKILQLRNAVAGEIYHSAWRFENINPNGPSDSQGAFDLLKDAHSEIGVDLRILLSGHALGIPVNDIAYAQLSGDDREISFDGRFSGPTGSCHQKFTVFKSLGWSCAMMGSIDISKTRLDRPEHLPAPNYRYDVLFSMTAPSHDFGIKIEGPAILDMERSFKKRWNDSTSTSWLVVPSADPIVSPDGNHPSQGTISIQILETFGLRSGYSWSAVGEFSIWAAYLNAIKKATKYIYIEDQYFLTFGYPPHIDNDSGNDPERDHDIIYQLGEALKRGVAVVVLVPARSEDSMAVYQKYQRDIGVNYLKDIASTAPQAGRLAVATLKNKVGNTEVEIIVHSKLLMVDDELAITGSQNVCRRSMTNDGEIAALIVDEAEVFVRDLRIDLWREHMNAPQLDLTDIDQAIDHFLERTYNHTAYAGSNTSGGSRLRPYETPVIPVEGEWNVPWYARLAAGTVAPRATSIIVLAVKLVNNHKNMYNNVIDPYAGPDLY